MAGQGDMVQVKLLYDMSVLGWAHYEPRARTGIYRVIENIALGLLASGKCDLVGYASQGNDAGSLEYLGAHSKLSACRERYLPGMGTCKHLRFMHDGIRGQMQKFYYKLALDLPEEVITAPRVDLCHSTFYPPPEILCCKKRLPMVQTVYDLIPILFPHFFNWGEDQTVRTVVERLTRETFVLCISESTKNDLCNFASHVDPSKVFVTPLAASDEFYPCTDVCQLFEVRQKIGIPDDAVYFLSVCTLEPRKNLDTTIRSFVRLILEHHVSNVYLVLTGVQGWKYDKILAEIEGAEEHRNRIILTGFVPDEDLAPLYSGALAFVYMSLYEGFGLPPLEAMQCGTPVITSNTSSLPEVVGDAGIMIDPRDGDGLCQSMLDLYQKQELREDLAKRSLRQAARFSWGRCVAETIAVYHQATGK